MGLRDWFKRGKTPDPTLTDLYERQRRLEGDMRALERDQQSALDSVNRVLAKIVRRQNREAVDKAESPEDAPESTISNGGPPTPSEIFRRNQLARRR